MDSTVLKEVACPNLVLLVLIQMRLELLLAISVRKVSIVFLWTSVAMSPGVTFHVQKDSIVPVELEWTGERVLLVPTAIEKVFMKSVSALIAIQDGTVVDQI